tara:strand:- start:720 stop:1019 length:300 start_codon:yes stop_codon:yes gene_type:complete
VLNTTLLLGFVLASLVVVIPGPGVLYVVAQSTLQGARAGLADLLFVGVTQRAIATARHARPDSPFIRQRRCRTLGHAGAAAAALAWRLGYGLIHHGLPA